MHSRPHKMEFWREGEAGQLLYYSPMEAIYNYIRHDSPEAWYTKTAKNDMTQLKRSHLQPTLAPKKLWLIPEI